MIMHTGPLQPMQSTSNRAADSPTTPSKEITPETPPVLSDAGEQFLKTIEERIGASVSIMDIELAFSEKRMSAKNSKGNSET